MNNDIQNATGKGDTRRYVATGLPNIQRLQRHEGDTEGLLFFLVKRKGKRIRRALKTSVLAEAEKRVKILRDLIRGEKWTALAGAKERGGFVTLPKLFETYLAAATIKVKKRNVKALQHVLRVAGKNPEGSSEQLTAVLVWQFNRAMLARAGEDMRRQGKAGISANSHMRQARSIFAAPIMPAYNGLTLPDIVPFMKAAKAAAPRVQYVEPPAGVMRTIAARYLELKAKDPGAYAWFLLGAFVGLRNTEVCAAEWSWIEEDGDGDHWLRLATRPHWRSKTSRSRDVKIPGAILAELHAIRGVTVDGIVADRRYLVPGGHKTERTNRALRRLNQWLRACGLDAAVFDKGFYELRKFFGNTKAWSTGDLYHTARVMGNSPQVVEQYYSSDRGRAPIAIEIPKVSTYVIRKATRAMAAEAAAPALEGAV